MTRLFVKLAMVAIVGNVISSSPTVAQVLPPAKKAGHVEIIQGPVLELAHDDLAVVRWTTTNPAETTSTSESCTTARIPVI
jgi:hypothetical protein